MKERKRTEFLMLFWLQRRMIMDIFTVSICLQMELIKFRFVSLWHFAIQHDQSVTFTTVANKVLGIFSPLSFIKPVPDSTWSLIEDNRENVKKKTVPCLFYFIYYYFFNIQVCKTEVSELIGWEKKNNVDQKQIFFLFWNSTTPTGFLRRLYILSSTPCLAFYLQTLGGAKSKEWYQTLLKKKEVIPVVQDGCHHNVTASYTVS